MNCIQIAQLLGAITLMAITVSAPAHSWSKRCTFDFKDQLALDYIVSQARAGIAAPSFRDDTLGGRSMPCDLSDPDKLCLSYFEGCTAGVLKDRLPALRLEEAPGERHNHYHLPFENADQLTCLVDPGDGDGSGYGTPTPIGGCIAPDWTQQPRYVSAHTPDHLLHLWVQYLTTDETKVFDLASIKILPPAHVDLWAQKSDGKWIVWRNMAPGRWNVSGFAFDVTSVMIRATPGSAAPARFDDVVLGH